VKEAKGRAKQAIGRETGSPNLKAAGTIDEVAGKWQKKTGQIKRDITRD